MTSIRRSFFTFIFARDAEDKRTTVLANAEDSRFSLRVTVLACISRFHDNFFRRQSQFLTPHSVQSAAPLRLVLLGARETDGDHGKKNS